jgi:hypothetical protein
MSSNAFPALASCAGRIRSKQFQRVCRRPAREPHHLRGSNAAAFGDRNEPEAGHERRRPHRQARLRLLADQPLERLLLGAGAIDVANHYEAVEHRDADERDESTPAEIEIGSHILGGFIAGKTFQSNQIEFLTVFIDYLTERGWVEARHLSESP